jgi:hypothetical protein
MFVLQNLEKIKSMLEFTLWVWWMEEREKQCSKEENCHEMTKKSLNKWKSVWCDLIVFVQQRVIHETESMHLSKKNVFTNFTTTAMI